MLLIIYYILEYYIGLKVFVGSSILQSKTIEPAVQPILYSWINEPANQYLHQFDLRSGSNNYVCPRTLDSGIYGNCAPIKALFTLPPKDYRCRWHVLLVTRLSW